MVLISTRGVRSLVILVIVVDMSFAYPSEKLKVITASNLDTNTLPDRTKCGLKKASSRAVNEDKADIAEFPWMVALEYKSKLTGEPAGIKCGGSLINSRHVLTAAQCIKNKEFQITNVRIGKWNSTTNTNCLQSTNDCADNVQKINIIKEIPHQYYVATSGENDIGLLRLEHDIEYTDYIYPICLPTLDIPTPEFGSRLTVAGWGTTDHGGKTSSTTLKLEVPLLPNINCSGKLQKREIDGNQLCVGGELEKGTCPGDSGGPLMRVYEDTVNQQIRWYQQGVVADGNGCGRPGNPAVYTRVSRYVKWIMSKISKE